MRYYKLTFISIFSALLFFMLMTGVPYYKKSINQHSFRQASSNIIHNQVSTDRFELDLMGLTDTKLDSLIPIPNVIGIGNKKCSTGALLTFLCAHPKMVCSPKETHFFDQHSFYEKGTKFYRSFFRRSRSDQLIFEKTPKYFTLKVVPSRIKETYEAEHRRVRFILLLCNPALRAYSDYTHFLRSHQIDPNFKSPYRSFDDYIEQELDNFKMFLADNGLEKLENSNETFYENVLKGEWGRFLKGIYSFHLQRWFKIFPRKDILVIDGDLLTVNPWVVMHEVQTFLNISAVITKKNFSINPNTGFYCLTKSNGIGCLGNNKGRTRTRTKNGNISSKISKRSEKLLKDFYKLYDIELIKLTSKTFSWMRKKST